MTIEIRNNKILTQGGKVRQVCDPCVPCIVQPPDPCEEFFVPGPPPDPEDVDWNPSYRLGTTLSTSATFTTEPVEDYKELLITKWFRLKIEDNPTININFNLTGADPKDNLSANNNWGSNWGLTIFRLAVSNTQIDIHPSNWYDGRSAARNIRENCFESFNYQNVELNPENFNLTYQVGSPVTFKYAHSLTQTFVQVGNERTFTILWTRSTENIGPFDIATCETVFRLSYRLWCLTTAGKTPTPPNTCPYPSSGSTNVTGSLTLDIEY
jgi:hypothetical protein